MPFPPSLTAHVLAAHRGVPLQWEQISLGGRSAGPAPRLRLGHQAAALDSPSGLVYMYGGVVVDEGDKNGWKVEEGVWTYDTRAQVGARRQLSARVQRRSRAPRPCCAFVCARAHSVSGLCAELGRGGTGEGGDRTARLTTCTCFPYHDQHRRERSCLRWPRRQVKAVATFARPGARVSYFFA